MLRQVLCQVVVFQVYIPGCKAFQSSSLTLFMCQGEREGGRGSVIPNSFLLTARHTHTATYQLMVLFVYLGISKFTFFISSPPYENEYLS